MTSIPKDVLAQHLAIVGKTGSGKTSTGKLAVEQVVGENYRVCILDTLKSDWWGITSSADGKKPGLPFKILGGPHGHVALHSSAGAVIGQLVGSGKLPLSIIDMADFEAGGLQRFFVDFAPALMKSMRGVLYLVLEEAHELAPKERSGFGAENMAIHYAKKLATAGRSKGIRMIVCTQRVQSLHNAVLGSCETLIAHRLTAPADQEPILKWLKANTDKTKAEEVAKSLSSLPRGTGWVCAGEAKIFAAMAFPKFKTYDNAATPTRDDKDVHVKTAAVDPDELRAIIGDAVKEADANDPKRLRARIAELERVAVKPAVRLPESGVEIARRAKEVEVAFNKGHDIGWDNAFISIAPKIQAVKNVVAEMVTGIERSASGLPAVAPPKPQVVAPTLQVKVHEPKVATYLGARHERRDGDGDISGPRQRILDAIALLETLGVRSIWKNQVAAVAGASPTSSAFTNNLGGLRTAGLIDYPRSGEVALTVKGKGVAVYPDAPPTVEEFHQAWLRLLPVPQGRILGALIEQYPEAAPKDALAEQVGASPKSSAYTNNLGSLRSLGVIDYPAKGMVVATDILFPVAA